MLRKSSFKNQAAVITDLGPDYQSTWYSAQDYITKYIKFTTQDAHNFTPGALVNINGIYSGSSRGTASAVSIVNARVIKVDSAKSFVIELPSTFKEPVLNVAYFSFSSQNYYVNSSGLGSIYPWSGLYLNKAGWDLYKVNPLVTAYCNDGNLGAYKLSYGDTL